MIAWLLLAAYLTVGLIVGAWFDTRQMQARFGVSTVGVVLIGALWLLVLFASATLLAFAAVLERSERL